MIYINRRYYYEQRRKKSGAPVWLWIIGWILIFPVPLTALLLRKMNFKAKYGIIGACWLLYLIIIICGVSGKFSGSEKVSDPEPAKTKIVESNEEKQTTTAEEENTDTSLPEETEAVKPADKAAGSESSEKPAEPENDIIKNETDTSAEQNSVPASSDESVPEEYKTALRKAEIYSDKLHMSKQNIYDQLTSHFGDRLSPDAAQYAVDNLFADYYKNALEEARAFSDKEHLSKQTIYVILTSEYGDRFTEDEAQYAMDNLNADYNLNALEKAKSYLKIMDLSKDEMYELLSSDQGEHFTPEEAQYAVDNLEFD